MKLCGVQGAKRPAHTPRLPFLGRLVGRISRLSELLSEHRKTVRNTYIRRVPQPGLVLLNLSALVQQQLGIPVAAECT